MENPLTAEEKAEEQENKRNDAELHSLIKASRLLEQYNADQLDGADRRRHQRDQLVNLGIQVRKGGRIVLERILYLYFGYRSFLTNLVVAVYCNRKKKRSRSPSRSVSG